MSDEILDFIDSLSAQYIGNRYPDFSSTPKTQIDKNTAQYILEKTKEVFEWLLTLKK